MNIVSVTECAGVCAQMSEFSAKKETTQKFISQEWDLQLIFIFKNNMLRFVLKSLSQFWTVPGLAMQKN